MEPINLESEFGGFRCFMSGDHEPQAKRDPWNFELRSRRGRIWPYSSTELAAFTDRPGIGARLRRIPGVIPQQLGDFETVVRFGLGGETEREVFALLLPWKRKAPPVNGFGSHRRRDSSPVEATDGDETAVGMPEDGDGS